MNRTPRHSVSTINSDSSSARLSIWDASSPLSTPPSSVLRATSQESAGSLLFNPAVATSFTKGTSLFKLGFARIDVSKDAAGGIQRLDLCTDPHKRETIFYLKFPSSRLPIPHLEQPYTSEVARAPFRICFLEEQTMQTGGNLFQARPTLGFERWEDCIRFQEAVLGQQIIFVGGVAEIKSRGRGEECISQNVRIIKNRDNGRMSIVFFANSQRKEKRRYVSVAMSAVEGVEHGRKGKHALTLKLRGEAEILSSLRALSIVFLEEREYVRFCALLPR
jgi:hypothetical protein